MIYLQGNVIFLPENGFPIPTVLFTLTTAATPFRNIKTAWEMGGLIPAIFTGGGHHGTVNCPSLIQKDFCGWWEINLWPLLVIQSRVITSSHCFAFSHRYIYVYGILMMLTYLVRLLKLFIALWLISLAFSYFSLVLRDLPEHFLYLHFILTLNPIYAWLKSSVICLKTNHDQLRFWLNLNRRSQQVV